MLGPLVQQIPMAIYRNGDWSVLLRIKDRTTGNAVDITNWAFKAQLRKSPDSTTVTANAIFTLVNGPAGEVRMTFDPAVRRAIPCGAFPNDPESQYWYDLLASAGTGLPYRLVSDGPSEIHHGVTVDV
jgi:hypothetical protein